MDKVKALIIAVVVCIIAGLTAVTCYYQGEAARLQEEVTVTKGALKTASNTIQQMKERNAELSKLDKRYHDEIKLSDLTLLICVLVLIAVLSGCTSTQYPCECQTPPEPPAALMEPPVDSLPTLNRLIYPSENN